MQQECLNIVDVLNKFKSIEVTAAQLFELLPRLQVRYYSIASSDKVHPTTVAIVAVVDRDTMPSGKVMPFTFVFYVAIQARVLDVTRMSGWHVTLCRRCLRAYARHTCSSCLSVLPSKFSCVSPSSNCPSNSTAPSS